MLIQDFTKERAIIYPGATFHGIGGYNRWQRGLKEDFFFHGPPVQRIRLVSGTNLPFFQSFVLRDDGEVDVKKFKHSCNVVRPTNEPLGMPLEITIGESLFSWPGWKRFKRGKKLSYLRAFPISHSLEWSYWHACYRAKGCSNILVSSSYNPGPYVWWDDESKRWFAHFDEHIFIPDLCWKQELRGFHSVALPVTRDGTGVYVSDVGTVMQLITTGVEPYVRIGNRIFSPRDEICLDVEGVHLFSQPGRDRVVVHIPSEKHVRFYETNRTMLAPDHFGRGWIEVVPDLVDYPDAVEFKPRVERKPAFHS